MLDYLHFIQRQLSLRGIEPRYQHFRELPIASGQMRLEIPAYNSLVYFTRLSLLPPGSRIISDSRARMLSVNQSDLETLNDYSGLITLELSESMGDDLNVEFLEFVL